MIAALVTAAVHHHNGKLRCLHSGRTGTPLLERHRLERFDVVFALGNASLTNRFHLSPNASGRNRLFGQFLYRLGGHFIAA